MKKRDYKRTIIGVVTVMSMIFSLAGCGEEMSKYKYDVPTGPEEAGIFVEPVEGISDDFIRGVDISSVISEEQSGVVYKNKDGEEEDIFKILADAGVNYIRVRVFLHTRGARHLHRLHIRLRPHKEGCGDRKEGGKV